MSSTGRLPELDSLRSQVADLSRELAERDQTMQAQAQHLAHTLQDLQEQSHILRTIIEGTAPDTGHQFLSSLATHLTSTLHVRYAVIGEIVGDRTKSLRTLAVSVDGRLIDNFEYVLEHASCRPALMEPFWCCERGVQDFFPHFPNVVTLGVESHCGVSLRTKTGEVVGILMVMDTGSLPHSGHLRALMEVFAARATAELQRHRAEVVREKNEDTRREGEQRCSALLEHAPNPAYVKGIDGRYLYHNRPFENIFGIPRQGALGKTDGELFPPGQAAQFRAHDTQVLETGCALEFEEVIEQADGARTTIVHRFPLRKASGEIYAIGGIATDITDRKRAEEALGVQARHLVAAQALARLGSWNWDIPSGDVAWSEELYRIFGHEPKSIATTYDTFLTSLHPDDHDQVLAAVNEALVGTAPYDVECRIVRPSGEVRSVHCRGEVHRDDSGHPVRMDGTVLDITEHKRTEEALRESEERWHLAMRGSHDGIWDWNILTGEVFFSTRWRAMRGFEDRDTLNHVDERRSRIHPDDLDRVLQRLEAYLAKQQLDYSEEYRVQTKDGSYIWILDRGLAVWDESGTPVRMAGSETDITQRVRQEQALHESEARTRAIIEAALDAVISIDRNGIVIGWNPQAEAIFGYRATEAMGQKLSDMIIPPQYREAHDAGIARVFQTPEGTPVKRRIELSALHQDGHEFPVEFAITLTQVSGQPVFTAFVRDITEQKQAQETLVRSHDLMKSFVEQMPVAVAMLDADLRYVAVSRRWSDDYGRAEESLIGRHHYDVFPDVRNREDWQHIYQRCLTGAVERHEEDHFMRADGSQEWLRWQVRPWHELSGAVCGIVMFSEVITERKRAESALRESERRFTEFMRHLPGVAFMKDSERRYTYVNPMFERLFNKTREDWYLRKDHDLFPPDVAGRFIDNDRFTLTEDRPIQTIEQTTHDDGVHDWLVNKFPIHHEDGGGVSLGGVAVDITERKRIEEALRQHERQLQTVLDTLPVGVCFTDATGRVILVNPASHRIWSDAEHADGRSTPHRWALSSVLTTGEASLNDLMEIECFDGSRKIISNSAVPVRDEEQRITGAVVVNEDITARVTAENALRRTHAFLQSVVENIPHMIAVKDARNLRFVSFNKAGEQLLGLSRQDVLGKTAYDVLPEEDADLIFSADMDALTQGASVSITEHLIRTRSHGQRLLSTKKIPILGDDALPTYLLTISEDITTRTREGEAERQRLAQLIRFQAAQLRLAKTPHTDLKTELHTITQTTADILRVERVGIWLFNDTRSEIHCQDLYCLTANQHESGQRLRVIHYPRYFSALETALMIAAEDVRSDPRTNEFADEYLDRYHISSMLAVPIRRQGKVIGVLCLEQVGTMRDWPSEEAAFAVSIADQISLCLAAEERHQMESALRASEERFAKAFRSSPHPVIIAEVESGVIIEANDAAFRLFGYGQKDVEGRNTCDIGVWPSAEDYGRFLQALRKRGSVKNLEVSLRMKNGQLRQCLLSSELIKLHGKRCMVTVGTDITDQKRAEEALRQSEARFRTMAEAIPQQVWTATPDGSLDYVNQRCLEYFMTSAEALTGSNWQHMIHPDDLPPCLERWSVARATGQPYEVEFRLCRASDHTFRWHIGRALPLRDSNGHIIKWIGTNTDVTEVKQAEEALRHREQDLRHAMEERERISQDLHDGILQSLYAVGLGLESCKPLMQGGQHEKAFGTMEGAIGQLNHIMAEVRNFIAGLESEVLQGGDFETAVRTVINTVIQSHPIDCRVHIEHGALPYIPMDRGLQILNILREALSNIVRHAQASHISVSIRRLRRTIRIRIHDNGTGFDTKTAMGTGHGLLNMAARAKKIRTEFELHSAVGEGTTIILDLPKEEVYVRG